jgi:hypothetical protein
LIALTDLNEWNPQGKVSIREFLPAFVERYGFLKFPTIEEYDLEKGAVFQFGKYKNIDFAVTLFAKGIVVDTRASTEDAESILTGATEWAEQFFDIEHSPKRINRKHFLSELSFQSDVPFEFLNPQLKKLAARLGNVVSAHSQEPQTFDIFSLQFKADPPPRLGSMSLRIERLEGEPFRENKYFSSAPLPTEEHLAFLAEFESILQEGSAPSRSRRRQRS